MIREIAMRMASGERGTRGFLKVAGWTAGAVMVMSVIAGATIAPGYGGSAAAAGNVPPAGKEVAQPASLAGRWSGPYYGYGRHDGGANCGGDGCKLTYDIVACKDGWCGITVKDEKTCGAVGLHLAADPAQSSPAFKGKLELAKGSAPYTVEAWYNVDDESKAATLHFLGDTGPELVMMRRSFPFEADMARIGEPTCKLDKATS